MQLSKKNIIIKSIKRLELFMVKTFVGIQNDIRREYITFYKTFDRTHREVGL